MKIPLSRMNRKKILLLGAVVVVIIAAFAIYSFILPTSHFSGGGVSFDYPKQWQIYTPQPSDIETNAVAYLKTNNTTSTLTVYVNDAAGENLDYYINYNKNFSSTNGSTIISQQPVTIAGTNGYRIDSNYKSDTGTVQNSLIFFVKNTKEYELLFGTDSVSRINSDINTIVNSFQTTS